MVLMDGDRHHSRVLPGAGGYSTHHELPPPYLHISTHIYTDTLPLHSWSTPPHEHLLGFEMLLLSFKKGEEKQPHGDFSLDTVHTGPLLLTQNLEHLHQKSILSIALLVPSETQHGGTRGKMDTIPKLLETLESCWNLSILIFNSYCHDDHDISLCLFVADFKSPRHTVPRGSEPESGGGLLYLNAPGRRKSAAAAPW